MKKPAKPKPRQPLPMSETLRQAIRDSGKTLYRVAKDSRVPYATVHRFMAGQRSVSMEALEKLSADLGLRLVREERKG